MRNVWRPAAASNSRADGAPRGAGRYLLLLILLLAAAALPARAQEPPQVPFLRVEAGAHTAPVSRLAIDGEGRTLATVSDDKTLRLWSLPEGAPRAVIRPPIGPAEEGELYAVALSPDGSRAFVGGFTARLWDNAFAIYVFDTQTGRLAARLGGLPAPVQHLAVSNDGRRLAAALGGRAGIRVWDATNGRPVFEDTAFAAPARMVAFDRSGRLAASGSDGRVRIYDPAGRKLAERVPVPNGRPFGLAWSPDGTLVAVGFEDRLRVEVLLAADLRSVLVPDATGLEGEGLPNVAWASDGRGGVQLHAAGYARRAGGAGSRGAAAPPAGTPAAAPPAAAQAQGGRGVRPDRQQQEPPGAGSAAPGAGSAAGASARDFVIRRWADFGLGPFTDIPAARDAIFHMLPLPTGGLVYAAADPGWGRLDGDGALALSPRPPVGDFRATGASLAISADAQRVRFALRPDAQPLVFDARAGRLEPGAGAAGFEAGRTEGARIRVADWRNSNRPRLGATALPIGQGEFSRSLAILPREEGFLIGTDTHLRLFDPAGRQLDSVPTTGAVWGLAAGEGVAVAALGDGTLRWFDFGGGRLAARGALFVHADARRWVLWTPEALFDHSPQGGQDLVGVHLNGGRAQTPEWASFAQAYRALYAPGAVRARIGGNPIPSSDIVTQLGDVRARIGRLPVLAGSAACAVTPAGCTPVGWSATSVPRDTTAVRLGFRATDRGLGLGPVDVMVNDRIAARVEAGSGEVAVEVELDPGPNRIQTRLYADDRTLFAEGPTLEVRRAGEVREGDMTGRLVIVAVGVDQYADPSMNLRFAVADARTFAETLRAAGRTVFRDVQVTLLTDRQATRQGVLDALAQAAATTRPEDVFVLYLAGHGVRSEPDRRFLFLPSNVGDTSSWAVLRRDAIDEDALVAAVARIRARDGFLFVDTCHAGQITVDQLAAIGNETGRFLLAASSSVQEALDSYDDRNGVFAYAVREGLRGRAAADGDGRISALALGEWVMRRVPQLAAEKQHRQDAVFRTAQRDLRSFPIGTVLR